MAAIKMLVRKTLAPARAQIDSDRMELDAISVPSFERVINELDILNKVIQHNRRFPHRPFQIQRVK